MTDAGLGRGLGHVDAGTGLTGTVTARRVQSASKANRWVAIGISSPGRRRWVVTGSPFTRVPLALPRSVMTKPSAFLPELGVQPGNRGIGDDDVVVLAAAERDRRVADRETLDRQVAVQSHDR